MTKPLQNWNRAMTINQTPAYNLKAVLQETGLAADTLRAWERRYGLPMPQRTEGGHRLYSQYDIETVKWLIARQNEGLSISRAVEMWKEQTASGADPLAASPQPAAISPFGLNLESVRENWLTACCRFDAVAAEQILNQAFATHSVEITCTEVIQRGLSEIGERWHKGSVSVQQEHFASEIAMRRLEALISASPPPIHAETIVTACPAGEWHSFPLLLLTLLLRRRGWNVVALGANVPADQMEDTLEVIHPKLIILSAQTLITAISLRNIARALNKKGIQIAFGGWVFSHLSDLSNRIPAHFLGNVIETSIPRIESLIAKPIPAPKGIATDNQLSKTAAEFKQARPLIDIRVSETLNSPRTDYLDTANHFLGDSLSAALELGDIFYVSTELNWLINLLIEHKVSLALLPAYLDAYAKAVRHFMKDNSGPIVDWLSIESQKLKA
jgi:DNA-binding transcriptional MerR regulator